MLRTFDSPDGPTLSAYVFHDHGIPVIDFRKSWQKACVTVGVGRVVKDETDPKGEREFYVGLLFHDLRRSAIRDMVRAGVPPTIARGISGHETEEVVDRYNIINAADTRKALAATQVYRREQKSEPVQNPHSLSVVGSGSSKGSPRK